MSAHPSIPYGAPLALPQEHRDYSGLGGTPKGPFQIGRISALCFNNDPVCGPDEHAEHRYQIDWLIDAHRPLAELLSRVIDKPIQIEQQIGLRPFRRSFHALWR